MAAVFGRLCSRRWLGAAGPWLRRVDGVKEAPEAGLVSLGLFCTTPSTLVPSETPSIQADEIEKFRRMAKDWWNPKGAFQPLHQLNPTRCKFIRDFACLNFKQDRAKPNALEGLEILDVGCGGGILSESIARMGASVTGIDAVEESIEVAKTHAQNDPEMANRLQYEKISAESLASRGKRFDVVMASEVIEHINNPRAFVAVLESLIQPNGAVIISTINRTPQAYVGTILFAENIMKIVPRGTHEWRKFIMPDELAIAARDAGLEMRHLAGMSYNPILDNWSLTDDSSINYIAGFVKQDE